MSLFVFQLNFAQLSDSKKEKRIQKNQERDLKEIFKINTDYIEILPKNKILIGLHGGGADDRIVLRNNKTEKKYNLSSDIVPTVGLHFKFKRLPIVSFSLPLNLFSKNSERITKGYSLGLHFQASRLVIVDAYFFRIDGLKLQEIDGVKIDNDSTFHGSSTLNATLETFYVFNNAKYSYKNAYLFGENQKKSAGSIVLGISNSFFYQENDKPLFNTKNPSYMSLNYKKLWGFSTAAMLGYLHTFVIGKNWYLGGGFLYGPNIHFGEAEYASEQKTNSYVNVSGSFRAKVSAGYNSKNILLKLIGHTDFYGYYPNKNNALNNYITDIRLSFTYII